MFDNVGGKIKALAAVLGWIDFIAGFIIAFAFWAGEKGFWTGMIPLLTGAALFAASWPLYGFGQLVEDVSALRQRAEHGAAKSSAPAETFGDLPEL